MPYRISAVTVSGTSIIVLRTDNLLLCLPGIVRAGCAELLLGDAGIVPGWIVSRQRRNVTLPDGVGITLGLRLAITRQQVGIDPELGHRA